MKIIDSWRRSAGKVSGGEVSIPKNNGENGIDQDDAMSGELTAAQKELAENLKILMDGDVNGFSKRTGVPKENLFFFNKK